MKTAPQGVNTKKIVKILLWVCVLVLSTLLLAILLMFILVSNTKDNFTLPVYNELETKLALLRFYQDGSVNAKMYSSARPNNPYFFRIKCQTHDEANIRAEWLGSSLVVEYAESCRIDYAYSPAIDGNDKILVKYKKFKRAE